MGPTSSTMNTPDTALKAQPITLQILATPTGVLIQTQDDITAATGPASVARTLCAFADGLIEGAQLVRLAPEIAKAVL